MCRSLSVVVIALLHFGCSVVADNPFDPSTPPERQARAQLEGTVTGGPDGTALLKGAVVTLEGSVAVADSPFATTEDGAFLFTDLVPGVWTLTVTHPQHKRRVVEITLVAGAVERPNIELELIPFDDRVLQGHISGKVQRSGELARPESDRDHSGILVEVEATGIRTVTGTDGGFDIFLQPGTYNLVFTTRHYNLARRNGIVVEAGETAEVPDSPVVLDSNPGSVSGSVKLEGVGELGEHDDVSVTLIGGESNVSLADGTFVITGVAAGTHTLVASKPGWDSVTFPGVVVEGGRETTLPQLRLNLSRGAVKGRVRLAGRTDHFGVAISITGTTLSAVSTPDGSFSIDRVPVGSWEVSARRDGFVRAVVGGVQVVADGTADVGTLNLAALQGDFDIDGGALYARDRDVTLSLSAQNATTMRISEDPTFERGELGDTAFRDFEVSPTITLSAGDGLKEVFVQLGLADGTQSGVLSGRIVLDTTPPESASVTIDMGASYTRDPTGRVSLSLAATDATSGLASMQISNDETFDEPWVPYSPGLVHSLADADTEGERHVYVRFRDAAGNESPDAATATITLDRTPPVMQHFGIDCDGRLDAAFCRSSLVSLALDAEGASRMLLSNQAGFPGDVQEPYAPARAWLLEPGDGSRTVHVQLMDEAGNRSSPGSATTIVDGTPPGSPFVRVESGAWTRTLALTLQLGAVGADELRVDLRDADGARIEGDWEPYATSRAFELPDGPDGTYRLEATFRDLAGNTSATATATVTLDREAPVGSSVRVSTGGVTATQVVSLELTAFGASEMKIAVDGTLDTEAWEAFSPVRNVTLPPGDGTKSIVVRFRDAAGNESSDVATQVVLDTGLPGGSIRLAGGATHTRSSVVAVLLDNVDEDVVSMQLSEDAGFAGASWQPFIRSLDHALSPSDGVRTLYVRFRDPAGNVGPAASASIIVDTEPPGSPQLSIVEGAYVATPSVTLGLGSVGASAMRIDVIDADGARIIGAWESYATTKNLVLPSGDGVKRVEVTYRDEAGNESETKVAQTTLDTSPPTALSLAVRGAPLVASRNVELLLSATGATSMRVAIDGVLDTELWEPYAGLRAATLTAGDGEKSIVAEFRDNALNVSETVSATVTLDATAPTGVIVLNNGATLTTTTAINVMLEEVSTDVQSVRLSSSASFTGSVWQSFLPSFTWTLTTGDGLKTVFAQFRDSAGNLSTSSSASITLDTQGPTSPTVSITQGLYVRTAGITLAISAGGADQMRVDVIDADGSRTTGSWETYATSKALNLPTTLQGTKRVEVSFRDLAGNLGEVASAQTTYDTVAPTGAAIAVGSGDYATSSSVTATFAATGASQMVVAVDGVIDTESWETFVGSKGLTLPGADGVKTVAAKFRDEAGNETAVVTDSITLDTSRPAGTLEINAGASRTNQSLVSLTFAGVSADVTEMQLSNVAAFTGATWQAYTQALAWTLSAGDGLKTVYAKFRDAAGNTSVANASASITLDTQGPTSPTVSITQGLYVRTAGINLAISAGGADQMRVDMIDADGSRTTGSWETYATSKALNLPTTLQGTKRVEVSFRDLAGNMGEVASAQTTYDTVAPTGAAIAVGSGDYATSSSVTATFAATGASQMVVAVDGVIDTESWETFVGSKGLTLPGADGVKTVAAKFRDEAGNETAVVTDSITLDTSRPAGTLEINAGASRTNQSLVSLTFAGVSADVTEMQLSNVAAFTGATWQAYTQALAWTLSSGDGTKTVYARFRDAAGNTSVADTSASITLDTHGPTSPSISVSGGAYTNSANVTLTLSAVGADEMRIVVIDTDGSRSDGNWIAYATSHAITLPSTIQGTKGVEVVFRDFAGNTSTIASAQTVFDTVAPSDASVSILGGEFTNDETVQLALNALGADAMRISTDGVFDGEPWSAFSLTSSVVLPPGDGLKTVRAVFRDRAGNLSSIASDTITLDKAPPSGTISLNGGAARTASTVVQAALTRDSASTSQMMVSTDPAFAGASWQPFSATLTVVVPSGDGTKTVYVRFRDGAGNESLSQSDSIILDTTGPQGVSITVNGGAAWTNDPSVSLALAGGDAVQMQLANRLDFANGSGWVAYDPDVAWSLDVSVFGDGQRDIYAQFRDELGNLSQVAVATIGLDTTPPVIHAFEAVDAEAFISSAVVPMTIFGSDALSGVELMQVQVSPDGPPSTFIPYATEHDVQLFGVPPATSKAYTMSLVLKDRAGNVSPIRDRTIVYDATPPIMTSFSISPAVQTASTGVNVSIGAMEPAPGTLDQMQVSESPTFEGAAWEAFAPLRFYVLTSSNGTKTVYGRVKDKAGNVSASMQASVVLDTQAPAIVSVRVMAGSPLADVDYVASPNVTLRVTTDDNLSVGNALSYATSTTGTLDCATASYSVAPASTCTTSPCVEDLPVTLPSLNDPITVYVCARDAVGNVSLRASDVVLHDQSNPPMVTNVTLKPFSRALEVRWLPVVDQGSGVDKYEVQWSTTGFGSGTGFLYTTSTEVRIEELENRIPYYVRVRAIDRAKRTGPWSSSPNAVLGYSVGRSATAFSDRTPEEHSSVLVDGRLWVSYRLGSSFGLRSCDVARSDCRLAENWSSSDDLDPTPLDVLGSQETLPIVAAFERLWVGATKVSQFGSIASAGLFSCNYRQSDCHDAQQWTWTNVEMKVTSPASTVHPGPVALHYTGSRLVFVYTRITQYDGPRPVVASCSRDLDCTDFYGWTKGLVQQPYPYMPQLQLGPESTYAVTSTAERMWLVKRLAGIPRLGIATCLWASGCNEPADFTEYQLTGNTLEAWPTLVRAGGRLYLAASGIDRKSVRLSRCDIATGCVFPTDWTHGPETFSFDAIRMTFAAEGARRLHAAWHVDPHGQVLLASCENPETTDCTSSLTLRWPRFFVDQNVVLPTRPSLVVAGTQPLVTYLDHQRFFRFGGPRVMTPFDASFSGGHGTINASWTSAPHVGGYEHVFRTNSFDGWQANVIDDPMTERSTIQISSTPFPVDQQTALRSYLGGEMGDESPISTFRPFKWGFVLGTEMLESETCYGGLGTCARYAGASNDWAQFLLRPKSATNVANFSMCSSSDCSSGTWPVTSVLAADGVLHEVAVAATNTHVYVAGRTGASNRIFVSRCELSTGCSQSPHFSTPLVLFGSSAMTGVLQVEVSDTRAWVMATDTLGNSVVASMLHSADPAQAASWTIPQLQPSASATGTFTGAVAPAGEGFSLFKATPSGLMRTYRTSMNPVDPLQPWRALLPASEPNTLRATVSPQGAVSLTTVFDGRLWVGTCALSTAACAEPASWSWVSLVNWEPSLGSMVDIKNRNGVLYVGWMNFDELHVATCRNDCGFRENWSVTPVYRVGGMRETARTKPFMTVLSDDRLGFMLGGTVLLDGKSLPPVK